MYGYCQTLLIGFLKSKKVDCVRMYTQEEYDGVLSEKARLEELLNTVRAIKSGVESKLAVVVAERDELKALVREQTEADLLVNALKGVGVIAKEPGLDVFKERERLLAKHQQAGSMTTNNYGGYSNQLLSGMGLFGR